MPQRQKAGGSAVVDWNARDIKTAAAVKAAAAEIMNAPGRPVKVSADAIYIKLTRSTSIRNNRQSLPLTVEAINSVTESPEELAIRRVKWAAEIYRSEGVIPTRAEFMIRAGIGYQTVALPRVESAINEAFEQLNTYLPVEWNT